MIRYLLAALGVAFMCSALVWRADEAPLPAKPETLKCVRIKQVDADARITYLCVVQK